MSKKFKGAKWDRKRTTRLDSKCYGPPGYVHWEVSQEGDYIFSSITVHDGSDNIEVSASGYCGKGRSDTVREFRKTRNTVLKLIHELETFVDHMDELEQRGVDESERRAAWNAEQKKSAK